MLPSASARNPEDEASRREMSHMLEAAIDQLPAIYRIVFVMREMEQMSTAETASALEIAEETTKVRLHRAKGLLREAMSTRMQASLSDVYPFLGRRCDRIVRAVMSALASQPLHQGPLLHRVTGSARQASERPATDSSPVNHPAEGPPLVIGNFLIRQVLAPELGNA